MKTIHKYEISWNTHIEMPKDASVLCVQTQFDRVFIWVEVNTVNEPEIREFKAWGTGHEINDERNKTFIGTIQLCNHSIVLHVFEMHS